jgi:hypothetical protein
MIITTEMYEKLSEKAKKELLTIIHDTVNPSYHIVLGYGMQSNYNEAFRRLVQSNITSDELRSISFALLELLSVAGKDTQIKELQEKVKELDKLKSAINTIKDVFPKE